MGLSPRKIRAIFFAALLGISALLGGFGAYASDREDSKGESEALLRAERMMSGMTLEEKLGQMFMVDFRKRDGRDVTAIDKTLTAFMRRYKPGGVILFSENTVGTLQTLKLTRGYQKASPKIPLFIAVDQEGGAVTRLQSGTVMPGNMALGAAGNPALVRAVAKATAEELKALGINMDFAPVVDVNNNPANPVIGVRSFGDHPEAVAGLAVEFMKGLHEAGVIAAAKHFPGHGDTAADSHIDLPAISHDLSRLEGIEFVPFKAMIQNGVDMIMTAHITFPAIDEQPGLPATLSHNCLTGLLREKMGYTGIIITDAFSMKAITDRFGENEAAAMAIKAGADIVLMPQSIPSTFEYILKQVKSGEISEARIDSSVQRILALKIQTGIVGNRVKVSPSSRYRALKIVGGTEHAFIRSTVAERAVTLLKNEGGMLPFKLEDGQSIAFFAPTQPGVNLAKEALLKLAQRTGAQDIRLQGFNYDGERAMTDAEKDAVQHSDFVLLFTRSIKAADLSPDSFMPEFVADLVKDVNDSGRRLAVVAVRNPYDIQVLNDVKAYMAVYTDWAGGGVEAAVNVIFGKTNPTGKLPVSIPNGAGEILYPNGYGLSYAIEEVAAINQSERIYLSLTELWKKGILDDAGSFKPDAPVDGGELVDLLKRMLLVTRGQTFEIRSSQGALSRSDMIGLFKKAARIGGLDPSAVKAYFDSTRGEKTGGTQAEMVEAALGLLKLLEPRQ